MRAVFCCEASGCKRKFALLSTSDIPVPAFEHHWNFQHGLRWICTDFCTAVQITQTYRYNACHAYHMPYVFIPLAYGLGLHTCVISNDRYDFNFRRSSESMPINGQVKPLYKSLNRLSMDILAKIVRPLTGIDSDWAAPQKFQSLWNFSDRGQQTVRQTNMFQSYNLSILIYYSFR